MTPSQLSKTFFNHLRMIYLAILSSQLLFGLLLILLHEKMKKDITDDTLEGLLQYLVPAMIFIAYIAGQTVFRHKLGNAKMARDLAIKMNSYRTGLVVRFILLEGASLFSLVAYMLTGNIYYIGFSGLVLLYFLLLWPTRKKATEDMGLKRTEERKINDPDEAIADEPDML